MEIQIFILSTSGSKTDTELTDEESDLERSGTITRRHRSTSGSSMQVSQKILVKELF